MTPKTVMTILPLSDSILFDVLENKDTILVLDFNNSKMPYSSFLRYILNIGIQTHIDPSTIAYDDKVPLLMDYINDSAIRFHHQLNTAWKQILLYSVGYYYNDYVFLTKEELALFCTTHKEQINSIIQFLYSLVFFQYYKIANEVTESGIKNDLNLDTGIQTLNAISLMKDADIPIVIQSYLETCNGDLQPLYYECFNGERVGRSMHDLSFHLLNENNHLLLMISSVFRL